jgi:iron complex outermembrane receptor protein
MKHASFYPPSLLSTLLGALLVSTTTMSTAQAATAQELDAVTVSASRLDTGVAGTPLYVIDRGQIEKSTARNISELLAGVPGISVRQIYGTIGTAGTIDMRGFGPAASVNTLILVDGRRLNDVDLSSTDVGGVPLANIERIEIQPGGGSVLYGDGASGGTINIITRQAQKSGGNINLAAGSFGTREATASGELVNNNIAVGVFGQHQETDGYRQNSDVKHDNAGINLRIKADQNEWYLLTQGGHLSSRLPGVRTVDPSTGSNQLLDDPRGTNTPNNYGDENRYQGVLGWKRQINDNLVLTLDGGGRHKEQRSFFDFGGGYTVYTDTTLNTFSLTPRLRFDYDTGPLHHTLQTGFDWYHTDYTSLRGQAKNTAPIHNIDIDADTRSPYLFLTSQWQKTTLSLGARHTRASQKNSDLYNPLAPGGAFDSQALPTSPRFRAEMYEIGLSQELLTGLTAMLSASRSVRLGTVDETYQYDSNFLHVFSPLRPQIGHNLEGSLVYTQDKSHISTTVYQQKLRDEIQFNAVTFANENIAPTVRRGTTIAAGTEVLNNVTVNASYTYQRALFRDGTLRGKSVALVPEKLGFVGIQWQVTPHWDIALSDAYTGSQYFENDNSNTFGQKIPAHHRLDSRAGFKWKKFNAGFTVANIADKKYYEYGVSSTSTPGKYNTYPMPGREYRFDLGYSF